MKRVALGEVGSLANVELPTVEQQDPIALGLGDPGSGSATQQDTAVHGGTYSDQRAYTLPSTWKPRPAAALPSPVTC